MIEVIFTIVLLTIYFGIGLPVAAKQHLREVKAGAVKKINIPPMPPKPDLKLSEILHSSGKFSGRECNSLSGIGGKNPCTCQSRDEWYKTKVGWDKYNEWQEEWYDDWRKQYRNQTKGPTNPAKVVAFWPFYLPGIYVEKVFKNSPDFEYIKYLEEQNEIEELH